jgi:hypothetical protein
MHDDREDLGSPGSSRTPKTRAAEPRNSTHDHRPHPAPPTRTGSDSHTIPTNMDMYKTDEMETHNDEQGLSALARKAFEKIRLPPSHHPHLAPTTRACSKSHDHGSISVTKDTNKTDQFGYNSPPCMMTESGSPDLSHTHLAPVTEQGYPDFATHESIQAKVTVTHDGGPDHQTCEGTTLVAEPRY